MLEKVKPGAETLRHFCPTLSRRYQAGRPAVYLHDCHAYLEVGTQQVWIKFCPYCSVEVEKEIRP